ncbi:MAG TPA: FtsW/RodA/SpoVE family cell cycle protein [Ktedonobacteraceae bacterium]|jgi:cell division protein FtsW (lipid II flippase)|nr:FtsW/RodA/SpoVE family cell cycle protein [Ktedonobacteraceae bacterium]
MASIGQSSGIGSRVRRYRWKELGLFIIPFMILLLEIIQLPLAQFYEQKISASPQPIPFTRDILPTVSQLFPILGLIALLLIVNILLSFTFPRADQMLLPLAGLLSGLGVLMVTRLGDSPTIGDPTLGTRQLLWVLLGLVVCVGTLAILRNMHWLERFKYTWAALGIALVAATLVNALRVKNLDSPTHDQLNFGPFNLQPSELLKIFIVIFFAAYLSENQDVLARGNLKIGPLHLPPLRQLGPLALMLGIALLLFLGIRELGLALLIYGIFLCMIYLGTNKLSWVVVSLGIFLVLGLIGYALFSYVRLRFAAVAIDPVNWQNWSQATQEFARGSAAQIVQGIIALSSGGILGAGFGLGHPVLVPVVQSDMIFTAFGEEYGLAGLFAIIGIYLLILYRGFRIAMEANDTFSQLLAAGLTSIFAVQTVVIIAGNMKLLPLTGLPLPFVSYGGSSIIANYIIIGILLRISDTTAKEQEG